MKFTPPEYGVELIAGVPGSGKSLFLVRRMLTTILEHRRPVFTNLPLVWRSCRWYLRKHGGEKLASMLYELSEEHLRRFAARQLVKAKFREQRTTFRRDQGQRPMSADALQAAWEAEHGRDICTGPDANWVLPGAVVIIDEAHRWFPQALAGSVDKTVESWITMHRHHFHWIWLATQEPMQVAVTIRRNLAKFWQVRNMGEDKLAWGVRFKHLGIRAMGYASYTGDQVNAKVNDVKTPIDNYVFFPKAPWNQVWFRLYRSFTHVASPAQMRRQMERARIDVGLLADGSESRPVNKKTHGFVGRSFRVAARAALIAATLGLVASVGFVVGRSGHTAPSAAALAAAAPKRVELKWGAMKSVAKDSVRVDGLKVPIGGRLENGAVLEYVSLSPRAAVFTTADDVFVWKFGTASPERVGGKAEVYNLVKSGAFGPSGGGQSGPTAAGGSAVEPAASVGVGTGRVVPGGSGGPVRSGSRVVGVSSGTGREAGKH